MELNLDEMYEQASKDAHYAYNEKQRDDALARMELIKLARKAKGVEDFALVEDSPANLDFSEKTFTLEVTARRHHSNEVEGSAWFDPEEFAQFLNSRFTVKREDAFGLDGYNKHSGQDILEVKVKEKTEQKEVKQEKLTVVWNSPEEIELFLGKKSIASANYDEHGSSGIFMLENMAKILAKKLGLKLKIISK